MANFTEKQIQGMIADLRDEFGPDIATRELAPHRFLCFADP